MTTTTASRKHVICSHFDLMHVWAQWQRCGGTGPHRRPRSAGTPRVSREWSGWCLVQARPHAIVGILTGGDHRAIRARPPAVQRPSTNDACVEIPRHSIVGAKPPKASHAWAWSICRWGSVKLSQLKLIMCTDTALLDPSMAFNSFIRSVYIAMANIQGGGGRPSCAGVVLYCTG